MAQSGNGAAAFAGHWRVAGVAVSDTGVQALADNDPSLMGKRLTFSQARLAWDQPPATRDACVSPSFRRLATPAPAGLRPQLRKLGLPRPTAFAIRCRSGSWGPGDRPVVYRGAGGVLAMPWYDGGVLKLVRK
ncbi:hypothetical protein FSB78_04655 [Sphingomonas ginsenosidivorax]|uniref:Uncharacterized protein n=1 Tax=Sphingomonas ginsenosidivorax TaxID=862135 RepID=A0A5C6UJY8_9SPHN|nr:hypothetical protein FSB78_04655 [Sphingomonas ginsenosidivorax]